MELNDLRVVIDGQVKFLLGQVDRGPLEICRDVLRLELDGFGEVEQSSGVILVGDSGQAAIVEGEGELGVQLHGHVVIFDGEFEFLLGVIGRAAVVEVRRLFGLSLIASE